MSCLQLEFYSNTHKQVCREIRSRDSTACACKSAPAGGFFACLSYLVNRTANVPQEKCCQLLAVICYRQRASSIIIEQQGQQHRCCTGCNTRACIICKLGGNQLKDHTAALPYHLHPAEHCGQVLVLCCVLRVQMNR